MELPYLKSKNKNQGGGGPLSITADRTRDMDDDKEMIGHVASEFLQAIEKKDHGLLMDALTALVLHIQDQDKMQDSQEMGQ